MKINKTILKNIIREALDSGEFDSIVGEQDQETTQGSVERLTNAFMDKVNRIAPTELAQIDDVQEIINVIVELLNTLRKANPSDFTIPEFKRVGLELKKVAADMQNAKPEELV